MEGGEIVFIMKSIVPHELSQRIWVYFKIELLQALTTPTIYISHSPIWVALPHFTNLYKSLSKTGYQTKDDFTNNSIEMNIKMKTLFWLST